MYGQNNSKGKKLYVRIQVILKKVLISIKKVIIPLLNERKSKIKIKVDFININQIKKI